MAEMNKYLKFLICRNRTDGVSINKLCDSYGQSRETILRILCQNLVLPVDNGLYPTSDNKKRIIFDMKRLRSNPYLTLEQLNMRFPEVLNECVLNRNRRHTKEFVKSLSNNNQ